MPGRESAEVTRALALVAKGMTPYAAAKKVGIALSTIYRAIKRHEGPRRLPITEVLRQIRRAGRVR